MSSKPSRADRLIAYDFLSSCRNVVAALRLMAEYEHFSENKPVKYWYAVLRNVWLDMRGVREDASEVEEALEPIDTHSIPNRSDCRVSIVRELTHPLNSIIILLSLRATRHLSFVNPIASAISTGA